MLIAILSRTPLWVWAVLTGLLALGFWQSRPRQVRPQGLLILPAVMLALGLWSMAPVFAAHPLVALMWLTALLLSLWFASRLPPAAGARWLPAAGVLALPGSWMPMGIILVIFSLRYASGVMLAMHPEWRGLMQLQVPLALGFGLLSGLFLGRNVGLFRLTRVAPAATGATAGASAAVAVQHVQRG